MEHSTSHSAANDKNEDSGSDPIRLISHQSIDFAYRKDEIRDREGDETDPNDDSVCGHVFVVVIEMCQDTVFHVYCSAEMRDDEVGCVVEAEADE